LEKALVLENTGKILENGMQWWNFTMKSLWFEAAQETVVFFFVESMF